MKDAIDLISGRDLPKHQYNDSGIGIPYIMGASNIKNGQFEIERWTDAPTVIGKKGDIVLSVKGTVGQHFILNEEEVHLSRQVMALRVKEGFLNEYINFFLQYYINKLSSKAKGMIPGITREDILFIEVPNFDLERQLAVINVLKKALSLINKRKAQIEALNQLTQSVFLEMFGDPFSNIKMWNKGKLENLVFKITDGEHNNPLFIDSGYPMIMAKNVLSDGIDFNNISFISNDDLIRFRKKCNPELNDLLVVSRGATIGRTCVVNTDREFALMGSVILIKMNSDLMNSIFLKTLLSHPYYKNKLLSTSGSSAQQAIYLKDLKKLEIIKPDINLQNEFANIVTQIEKRKDLINKGLTELELIFNSLMQRAFKGELFNEESKVSNL
jgi:type I restriction enzyme S subunit